MSKELYTPLRGRIKPECQKFNPDTWCDFRGGTTTETRVLICSLFFMMLMREGDTPKSASPKGLGWPLHREKKLWVCQMRFRLWGQTKCPDCIFDIRVYFSLEGVCTTLLTYNKNNYFFFLFFFFNDIDV